MLLVVLSLVIWFSFQLSQTLKLRDGLMATIANLENPAQNAIKIRDAFTNLAGATKQLADQGNANASLVVSALAKGGITVNNTPAANPQAPAK